MNDPGFTIDGAPALHAKVRSTTLPERCWADRVVQIAGGSMRDQCGLNASTPVGLCAWCYRGFFGRSYKKPA